jgi:steroid 5-alpha reductase family enzyme
MTIASFLGLLLGLAIALSLAMAIAWLVWRRTGNSGWIDVTWTFGLGLTAIVAALIPGAEGVGSRQQLVAGLVAIWSLRLGLHIAYRTWFITEDPRYAALEKEWGDNGLRQMFILLQKQALVSLPLALAVVLVAITGATMADRQLRAFRANKGNRGRICDRGLWSWSRHPNYFFECLGWLAYPVIAINLDGAYPAGWFAVIGPACIYWLLRYVSGVPPLEAHMLETRGEAFRRYQARTSIFFPFPPKAGAR